MVKPRPKQRCQFNIIYASQQKQIQEFKGLCIQTINVKKTKEQRERQMEEEKEGNNRLGGS